MPSPVLEGQSSKGYFITTCSSEDNLLGTCLSNNDLLGIGLTALIGSGNSPGTSGTGTPDVITPGTEILRPKVVNGIEEGTGRTKNLDRNNDSPDPDQNNSRVGRTSPESPPLPDPVTPESYTDFGLDILPDGDPLAFAINGEACTIRREIGSHDLSYWKLNRYTTNPPITLNMNRSLCDNTYIFGIDRNNSGTLDSGYEILWLRGYDAFEILHTVDYYEGVFDGIFSVNDPL